MKTELDVVRIKPTDVIGETEATVQSERRDAEEVNASAKTSSLATQVAKPRESEDRDTALSDGARTWKGLQKRGGTRPSSVLQCIVMRGENRRAILALHLRN